MGYEVEWRPDPDNVYLRGGARQPGAAPHGRARAEAASTTSASRSPRPRDVDAWAAHLEAHGVSLKAAPRTHRDGSRSLYFHGPEGLLVQIIHHSPMVGLID